MKKKTNGTVPGTIAGSRAKRKAIGYIRVSRLNGREGDSYVTEEMQREKILDLAKANDLKIVAWYVDRDESGGKWDRPGFQSALADIEDGKAEALVVARLNRAARNVLMLEEAARRLDAKKAALVASDLSFDTTTPTGRLMRTILSALAQFELEQITENWDDVRGRALDKGVWSRRVPRGYLRDEKTRKLVVDPLVAPLVATMFHMRGAGRPWSDLRGIWDAANVGPISMTGLRSMIDNRAYLGEAGERDNVYEEVHEAIVTEEEYAAAQRTISVRPPRKSGEGSLLASLLVCVSCGEPMTTGRTSKDRGSKPTYSCKGASQRAVCTSRQTILQELADVVVERSFRETFRELPVAAGTGADVKEYDAALATLADAEAERAAFVSKTDARSNYYQDGLDERNARVENAETEVERIRGSRSIETHYRSLADDWTILTKPEKRALLAQIVDRIEVGAATSGPPHYAADVERKIAHASDRLTIAWKVPTADDVPAA